MTIIKKMLFTVLYINYKKCLVHIIFLDSSLIDDSLGFIYSEKLYSKEMSPLEFLSLDVVSRNIDGKTELFSGKWFLFLVVKLFYNSKCHYLANCLSVYYKRSRGNVIFSVAFQNRRLIFCCCEDSLYQLASSTWLSWFSIIYRILFLNLLSNTA